MQRRFENCGRVGVRAVGMFAVRPSVFGEIRFLSFEIGVAYGVEMMNSLDGKV